jgi:hypothetical protein
VEVEGVGVMTAEEEGGVRGEVRVHEVCLTLQEQRLHPGGRRRMAG